MSRRAGEMQGGFPVLPPAGQGQSEVCDRVLWMLGEAASFARPVRFHFMSKDELVVQLVKIVLGILIGGYFLWWSLEVLKRLPPVH